MKTALYVIAACHVLGALVTIHSIGKPRKPTSTGTAIGALVIAAVFVFVLLKAARSLP